VSAALPTIFLLQRKRLAHRPFPLSAHPRHSPDLADDPKAVVQTVAGFRNQDLRKFLLGRLNQWVVRSERYVSKRLGEPADRLLSTLFACGCDQLPAAASTLSRRQWLANR